MKKSKSKYAMGGPVSSGMPQSTAPVLKSYMGAMNPKKIIEAANKQVAKQTSAAVPPQRGSVAQGGQTAGAGIQNMMPKPAPRPSDYRVGPLQFGRPGGVVNPLVGMQERDVRPMRVPPRMQPSAPRPVSPGGGYKAGGRVDGCAMRGKTKCKIKSYK